LHKRRSGNQEKKIHNVRLEIDIKTPHELWLIGQADFYFILPWYLRMCPVGNSCHPDGYQGRLFCPAPTVLNVSC